MRRSEIIVAVIFLALGAHVIHQATLLPYTEKYGPGPGFLPFWLGVIWCALALFHLANLAMQPRLYSGNHPFPPKQGLIRVISVLGVLLAATYLMGALGLFIALAVMGMALLIGVEKRKPLSSVVAAVLISGIFYILFGVILKVPFPRGPLGI